MYDKKLCFLKISIKTFIHLFSRVTTMAHWKKYINDLQVFLAQPVLTTASRTLIAVYKYTSASDKPRKVDDMNSFVENVELNSPCLVPSLYYSVSELKSVKIFRVSTFSVDARYWYNDIIPDINWSQNMIASGYNPFFLLW
jgi:hypothetical protein